MGDGSMSARFWLAKRVIALLKGSHHFRGLQRVFIGLVLYGPAQTIAERHENQPEDCCQHQYQRDGGGISEADIIVLRIYCPVQHEIEQVQSQPASTPIG